MTYEEYRENQMKIRELNQNFFNPLHDKRLTYLNNKILDKDIHLLELEAEYIELKDKIELLDDEILRYRCSLRNNYWSGLSEDDNEKEMRARLKELENKQLSCLSIDEYKERLLKEINEVIK
jgi:hypothetical protein